MQILGRASVIVISAGMLLGVTGVGRAQITGTGPAMCDVDGPKAPVVVTADGSYNWWAGGKPQGKISGSVPKQVQLPICDKLEIRAERVDDHTAHRFRVTVSSDQPNAFKIHVDPAPSTAASHAPAAPKPSGGKGTKVPTGGPPPPVTNTSTVPVPPHSTVSIGNPDMFVRINARTSPNFARPSRTGGQSKPAAAATQVTVMAMPYGGTHYDVKVQVVMKGVGSSKETVALPDLQPSGIPFSYSATSGQIGTEAVICYTGRPSSGTAERWTGTFNIQPGAYPGQVVFIPAHEPTLEAASNAPCGGLRAEQASVPAAADAPETADAGSSPEPSIEAFGALRRGAELYNAGRYQEARAPLVEACNGGVSSDACNSVGYMYQNHLGVATDYIQARQYYLKSCNEESSFSCNNLGTLYRDGLGIAKDTLRALQLFEKGCDDGVPEGCDAAGVMYRDTGAGVTTDYTRALSLFKQACDAKLGPGCGNEAGMYIRGLGVPKDLTVAEPLMQRGCDLDSRNSCWDAGMMLRRGDGVPRDLEKSKQDFAKACEMGDQNSCKYAH